MILTFPDVITEDELSAIQDHLARGSFVDGRETAGALLKDAKKNEQLGHRDPQLAAISDIVLGALRRNEAFRLATNPKQLHSVLVSRYRPGMAYGPHVDNALMGGETVWRTDLSMTLFLNDPADYDGGELVLESGSGRMAFKLPARCLLCYTTNDLHQVNEVTRGERRVVVGWIQSHVRDERAREALWDLAQARQQILESEGKSRAYELVNKTHTNLLRRWAEP